MRRMRRWREGAAEVDRVMLAIIAAGAVLLGAVFFPRVYPAALRGPECTSLASPIGGNNRSLLAQAGNDQQNLSLRIAVENDPVPSTGSMTVRVTFVNGDIGPVILYLRDHTPTVVAENSQIIGLSLELTSVNGSVPYTARPTDYQDAPWQSQAGAGRINQFADPDDLHLLGSRSRCNEVFTLNLPSLFGGLPPGDYRIRAIYYNNNTGVIGNPGSAATPTATPAYTDQGIWVGRVTSEEIRFTVG